MPYVVVTHDAHHGLRILGTPSQARAFHTKLTATSFMKKIEADNPGVTFVVMSLIPGGDFFKENQL